jgi:hypothetical protein
MTAPWEGNIRVGLVVSGGMPFGCLRMDSRLPNAGLALRRMVMIVLGQGIKEDLERHLGVLRQDVGGRKCRLLF